MGMMDQKFPILVKIGKFLEEGIKSGKIQSMARLRPVSKAIQSGSLGSAKKRKEEVLEIVPFYQPSLLPRANQYPINTHTSSHPTYTQDYNIHPHYNQFWANTHLIYHDHTPMFKPPLIKTDLLMLLDQALTSKQGTPDISPLLSNHWPNYLKGWEETVCYIRFKEESQTNLLNTLM